MKQIVLTAVVILILTACTVESPSNPANDAIQKAVLETFVAETVQAEHAKLGTPIATTEQAALATVTLIPVMTATQAVATLTAIPTMPPAVVPTLPKAPTSAPLPANYWQLLTNIPQSVNPGENMYVKVQTSPNLNCILSYACPGWVCDDFFDYHKTADANGICEWTWLIAPDSVGEVANIMIDVGGNQKSYELWINGPTITPME